MKKFFADLEIFQNSISSDFNNLNIDFSLSAHWLNSELEELDDAINMKSIHEVSSELGDCLCYFSICLNLTGYTFSQFNEKGYSSTNPFKTFSQISTLISKQNRPNGGLYKNQKLYSPYSQIFNYFCDVCDEHDLILSNVIAENYEKLKYREKIGYGVYN